MELLLAMGITIIGVVIILIFIKPSEKEIQAFKNLDKAKNDFLDTFAQTFKLDKFAEWLIKKMK